MTTVPTRDPADLRRKQLARIHAAKKALALDDDAYRAVLRRVTGVASSADMSTAQRNQVIAEFTRLGFKAAGQQSRRRVFAGKPKRTTEVPLLRKAEALLADAGREWAYAHGMAKRMFQVTRVEWLNPDQLHRLVAALQIDAKRRAAGATACK